MVSDKCLKQRLVLGFEHICRCIVFSPHITACSVAGALGYDPRVLHISSYPFGLARTDSSAALLTLEARRADDERLLEGVGPGGTELRRSRLHGHAPLGHGCHGGS